MTILTLENMKQKKEIVDLAGKALWRNVEKKPRTTILTNFLMKIFHVWNQISTSKSWNVFIAIYS